MVVIDAATGDSLKALDMTGVEGGIFTLSEIAITSDGQIWGANLTVSPETTGPVRVYRWANEDAAPVRVYDGPMDGPRYGDGVGVTGSGNDVTFFISGSSGQDRIAKLAWDGSTASGPTYIVPTMGQNRARYGIAPVPGTNTAWINNPGDFQFLALINTDDGSIIREIPDDVVSTLYGDVAYFEWNGRQYVATGPQFQIGEQFAIVDVTDAGSEAVVSMTEVLGTAPNGNSTGFVAYDTNNNALVVLSTNNALASYPLVAAGGNSAPTAATITAPAEGAMVTIAGDPTTPFVATWAASTDADGDASSAPQPTSPRRWLMRMLQTRCSLKPPSALSARF